MHRSDPISTELNMHMILAILGLLYTGMPTSYATPQVKLIPSDVVYFTNEGSLTLMCTVDEDVRINSVTFKRDGINYVGIFDPTLSQCSVTKFTGDTSVYSVNCDRERNFTLIKQRTNAENHRKKWLCLINSIAGGPCVGANNPCLSLIVTAILRVPVTTVQLMNGLGQTLTSSVNVVRGESTGIRCSTAPSGSRPRALFQWYYRQGNQFPILIVDQSISPTPDTITVPGQLESDLLISYSTRTLTGNVSYHNMYIFCEARDETNTGSYTQSDEVQLNIVYPPVVQLSSNHSTYNVTEGTQTFVFTCNIIEANPQPQANSYNWFHKTSVIQGQTTSFYTLPSIQKSDGGEYKCTARNDYGTGTSNSSYLNVQYPPIVTVMLTGSSLQNETAILMCEASGIPAETTFYPWAHMWEGVPIRTGLQHKSNSTHSVLTLDRLSLESMGTYICTASNGIIGISGKLNQTGLGSLRVKGKANILDDTARFVGEIGHFVNISIPFYSDPAIKSFVIQTNGRNVMNTSRTMMYLSEDIVYYKFHSKAIHLDAQKIHCVILNVTAEDFDNYTLVLTNSIGITSYQFHLDSFGPPFVVQRFYFNRFTEDQIEMHFDAGFNGGPEQTFVIQYMPETGFDSVWKNISVGEIREKERQYRLSNGTFFVQVTALSPGSYIYRMYSWNEKGRSPFSDNITVTIQGVMDNAQTKNPQVEAIAGGVGAAVVVIAIVIVVLILLRRGSFFKKKSIAENIDSELINRGRPKSGLVDNQVYDSSGPTPGTASGTAAIGDEYATVVKPKKNELYAQVDRTGKEGRKGTAERKGKQGKPLKGTAKAKGKQGATSKGDVYENATLALKGSAENVYENPEDLAAAPSSGENAYENPEASASKGQLVNKDGLLYADLVISPHRTKAGQPVIHGLDNRTEYAEISYGKRGEPVPESDEEKESDDIKKKIGTKLNTDE